MIVWYATLYAFRPAVAPYVAYQCMWALVRMSVGRRVGVLDFSLYVAVIRHRHSVCTPRRFDKLFSLHAFWIENG